MLTDSLFRNFDDDPFFSGYRERLHAMDGMHSYTNRPLAIGDKHHRSRQSVHFDMEPHHHNRGSELAQRHSIMNPFGFMSDLMMPDMSSRMGNMFQQIENMQNDPQGHSFIQSSVMSYSNDGSGQPKVYHAATSTRQAPGGIRETRKMIQDSEAGIEKMAVGRHINDRGHVITRQRISRTGDIEENQDYINLDEAEAPRFNDEWKRIASQYTSHGSRQKNSLGHQPQHVRAIDNGSHRASHNDAGEASMYGHGQPKKRHNHVQRLN